MQEYNSQVNFEAWSLRMAFRMVWQGDTVENSMYIQWKTAATDYQAAWSGLRKSSLNTWIQKSAAKYYQFSGPKDALQHNWLSNQLRLKLRVTMDSNGVSDWFEA